MMKKRMCALLLAVCVAAGLMLQFPVTANAAEVKLPVANVVDNTPYTISKDNGSIYNEYGINPLENDLPLDYAMIFSAEPAKQEQLDEYGDWIVDYELKINKDVSTKNVLLAGQYDNFGQEWLVIDPKAILGDATLPAGTSLMLMQAAGFTLTYDTIYEDVQTFQCGLKFSDEFWGNTNNDDIIIELTLNIYGPNGEVEKIGDTFIYTKGALDPHICRNSGWEKDEKGHFKRECRDIYCPVGLYHKTLGMKPHTFGADNFCTVCGYLRDADSETAPPKTGDATHTLLWTALFMGGMAVMWMQLSDRKRESF